MQTLKQPPASTSSCVNASRSMLTPIHFGSKESCVTQLIVIPLRRSARSVEPSTYRPLGIVHRTRRRKRSYSSGSEPSGIGPTIPSCTGMARTLPPGQADLRAGALALIS